MFNMHSNTMGVWNNIIPSNRLAITHLSVIHLCARVANVWLIVYIIM